MMLQVYEIRISDFVQKIMKRFKNWKMKEI